MTSLTLTHRWFLLTAAAVVVFPSSDSYAQSSTYQATVTGWLSQDQGDTQIPIATSQTSLPNGGQTITGGGETTVFLPPGPGGGPGPIEAQDTYVSAVASARPGQFRAQLDGFATDYFNLIGVEYGARAVANVGAVGTEYIPIAHPTLPAGSSVSFTVSARLNGITSSDMLNSGPYYFGPQFASYRYPTGTFHFFFQANTADGSTLAHNNDAVSSGTYAFPNSLFQSVPTSINPGNFFTYNMTGRVGDLLVLYTTLGLGLDNRAYRNEVASFGTHQESHLDFAHTANLYVDAITPGLRFVANGHNYATGIPEPAGKVLLCIAAMPVALRRRK
jgi:hypothetical protein